MCVAIWSKSRKLFMKKKKDKYSKEFDLMFKDKDGKSPLDKINELIEEVNELGIKKL